MKNIILIIILGTLIGCSNEGPDKMTSNQQSLNSVDATIVSFNYFSTMQYDFETDKINTEITVKDTHGKEYLFGDIVNNNPKLIFYMNGCTSCIITQLDLIKKQFAQSSEDLIILTRYQNLRELKIFQIEHKLNYQILNLTNTGLSDKINKSQDPLYFIIDGSCGASFFHFPNINNTDLTENYLKIVQRRL